MTGEEKKIGTDTSSSSESEALCNIEEIVDKIILKNKEKLDRLHLKEFGIEKLALKNKQGNLVYYLKKRSAKTEDEIDSKVFSKKIITEARKNLGEELEPDPEKEELPPDAGEKVIHKKRIRFGKKKESTENDTKLATTTKDLDDSEDYNKVISELEKVLDNKNKNEVGKDLKTLDKKIVKKPKVSELIVPEVIEEKLDIKPTKRSFFTKNKKSKSDGKKNIEGFSAPISNTMPSDDNSYKLDESPKIEEKKPVPSEIVHQPKIKKGFFKTKESADSKKLGLEQKEPAPKIVMKPVFHAEKIPLGDESDKTDAELLDQKIKESSEKSSEVEQQKNEDDVEKKAAKLAEEHIKQAPAFITPKGQSSKKIDADADAFSNLHRDSEQEHVFFDEEESSKYGWSPQMVQKSKNKTELLLSPEGEIDTDEVKTIADIELPKEVLSTKSVKLSELGFSESEWEELDFYPLYEPFAYVEILREKETLDKCYFLVEIALTAEEENLLAFVKDTLSSLSIDAEEMDEKGDDSYLLDRLEQVIKEYNLKISDESKEKIYYYIGKTSLGLGKIDPLMKDPNIEDVSCDGARVPLFLYHRKYGSLKSNVRFGDEDELSSFVFRLAQKCGKHISIAEPMLDATMPDGSRIQMTLSDEITAKGSTFTIRKFRSDPFSPPDLIEFNTMSSEMVAYMWLAVENGINTLFAGGTASGKTTALNALSLFIPRESKIVSIEETRELNLPHPNWIPGVARSGFGQVVADRVVGEIDMYDLMKAALRQRPEYIIVGEIRGKEAYVLFQAMATGHATYSTAHADSAQSLIHRLEGKPINIPRIMLQSLDVVCIHVITRVKNMRARRCKQIIEIIDIDPTTKEILTNEVFHWDPVEDKFVYSGKSYILERIRAEKDLNREEMTQEINNRKKIVEWMNKNNIRGFKEVATIVSQYAEAPEDTLKNIEKGVK